MARRRSADGSAEPGKELKKKKGFLDGYKTYDPKTEGYGSVNQWRGLFDAVMSGEQATIILKGQTRTPLSILGFATLPSKGDLKKKYFKMVMDMQSAFRLNPTDEETAAARELIAAYTVLLAQIERAAT